MVKSALILHVLFLFPLYIQGASDSNAGQILFDLDYPINKTFLQEVYNWVDKEISFSSHRPEKNLTFDNFPQFPLYSSAVNLDAAKRRFEAANTVLTIGFKTYFGMKFGISSVNTTIENYNMNYLPVFDFTDKIRASIVADIHKYLTSSPKIKTTKTIVVLTSHMINAYEPWDDSEVVDILLKSMSSEVRIFYYKNDATQIIETIQLNHVTDIILLVSSDALKNIFQAAYERSVITWRYRWLAILPIVSDFDISALGFNEKSSNITIIQFGDTSPNPAIEIRDSLSSLSYDAMQISLRLLQQVFWKVGPDNATIEGKTGNFTLNMAKLYENPGTKAAERKSWILQVYNGLGNRARLVGNISALPDGSNITFSLPAPKLLVLTEKEVYDDLSANPVKIMTVIDAPFVKFKSNASFPPNAEMKDRLEGFLLDVVKALMKRINLTYVISVEPTETYGSLQQNGKWNGLIQQIIDQRASLGAAGLTITDARKRAVDFLTPLIPFSGAILVKEEQVETVSAIFQFLIPFTNNVWYMVIGATLLFPIILTILDIASPSSRNFRLHNGLVFALSSIFQGSSSLPPDRTSGRVIVCFWWFFVLILTITYIANYGAIRRQTRIQGDISSLRDLISQNKYEYGTVKDTSYDLLFKSSTFEYMQTLNNMIRKQFANGLVVNSSVGIDLVKKGGYAFIWDNTVTRYYAYRDCLKSMADFDNYTYGFAIPKNADYKHLFNKHLNAMIASGEITEILKKYPFVQSNRQNPLCEYKGFVGMLKKYIPRDFIKPWSTTALTIANVTGIFLVLLAGCVLSFFIAILECSIRFCCKKIAERRLKRQQEIMMKFRQGNKTNQSYA